MLGYPRQLYAHLVCSNQLIALFLKIRLMLTQPC